MKTYAKLTENNNITVLSRIPHIINPTEKMFDEYASENGYKELIQTEQPNKFYTNSYVDGEQITEIWAPIDLQIAKEEIKFNLQEKLNDALAARTVIPCEDIENGIIYDNNALTNAMGLDVGDIFIDAQDGLHTVTEDTINNIRTALKNYRRSLYADVTQKRALVENATSVDELIDII